MMLLYWLAQSEEKRLLAKLDWRRLTTTRFAVAILLALTMPASADDIVSANHFLPGCKSALTDNKVLTPADALLQGRCTGFVQAFLAASPALYFCQPRGATIGQSV